MCKIVCFVQKNVVFWVYKELLTKNSFRACPEVLNVCFFVNIFRIMLINAICLLFFWFHIIEPYDEWITCQWRNFVVSFFLTYLCMWHKRYTITALIVRPFSGFLIDSFSRKSRGFPNISPTFLFDFESILIDFCAKRTPQEKCPVWRTQNNFSAKRD